MRPAVLVLLLAARLSAQEGDPRATVGLPRGVALAGAPLDTRTDEVAALLRCPVCQGLSVADSPASMAVKMKAQVRDMLAAGYDEEQILSYFERSYGEFVRLRPPLRGVNWLVWAAPLVGLLVGGAVVLWALRSTRAPAPVALPDRDALPEDRELARYVLKVREALYGWPGGARPRSGA